MDQDADVARGARLTKLRFGDYILDASDATLTRGDTRVSLQAQPARLLTLLVERAGAIVTRDDIRAHLWPDTTVEYDQSINYCVRQLRIALGSDADLIKTVPRQGYRFVIPGPGSKPAVHQAAASSVRAAVMAAVVMAAFALGFGSGIVTAASAAGQFVYVHLVHPDRCPYLRFLIPTHRNS